MKFTQTHTVYRDKVTGVCYTKKFAIKPIPVIQDDGKVTAFGTLLEPYGAHPAAADWIEVMFEGHAEPGPRAMWGFDPHCFGQDIFVTTEQLETRFECLGELSSEVDMEAAVRQYEAEHCDFTNREHMAESALRQLRRMVPALWACELYTLIKDYIAHTPKKA